MPRPLIPALLLAAFALPAAAGAQLVAERVQGEFRLCVYGGRVSNRPDDPTNRVIRHPRTERCPLRPPVRVIDRPPPPSAMLVSQTVEGSFRICTYQINEEQWRQRILPTAYCPLAAGMLPADTERRQQERETQPRPRA